MKGAGKEGKKSKGFRGSEPLDSSLGFGLRFFGDAGGFFGGAGGHFGGFSGRSSLLEKTQEDLGEARALLGSQLTLEAGLGLWEYSSISSVSWVCC